MAHREGNIVFDIIKKRKIWYVISLLIILPGLFSIFTQGFNLSIDFTGGNIIEVKFNQSVTTTQVREIVKEQGLTDNYIQQSTGNVFLIRTEAGTEKQNAQLLEQLDQKLGGLTLLRNDNVGPTVGKELTQKAVLALIIAAVLMTIYITWRFEFKQGIAAVIGIIHDLLVMLGFMSLLQLDLDSSFVAAILTVVGYSINDTIIIFDRIRENLRLKKQLPLDELINTSIWQTMARSINTVMTVLFVLVSLYLFGGTTIKHFVLILIIGVTSGMYSSIFISSTFWYDISEKKGRKKSAATA
jgi:preprotein translocase subunit SecF